MLFDSIEKSETCQSTGNQEVKATTEAEKPNMNPNQFNLQNTETKPFISRYTEQEMWSFLTDDLSSESDDLTIQKAQEDQRGKSSKVQTSKDQPLESSQLKHPSLPPQNSPNPLEESPANSGEIEGDMIFIGNLGPEPTRSDSVGKVFERTGETSFKIRVKRVTQKLSPNIASLSPAIPPGPNNRRDSLGSMERTTLIPETTVAGGLQSLFPYRASEAERREEQEEELGKKEKSLDPRLAGGRGRKGDISSKELDSLGIELGKTTEALRSTSLKDRLRSATPNSSKSELPPFQIVMTDPELIEQRLSEILVGRVKEIPIELTSDSEETLTPKPKPTTVPPRFKSISGPPRVESYPLKLRVMNGTTQERIRVSSWTTTPRKDVPRHCYGKFVGSGGDREHRLARGLPLPLYPLLAAFVVDSAQFRGNGNLWLSGGHNEDREITLSWLADRESNTYYVREFLPIWVGVGLVEFPSPRETQVPPRFTDDNPGFDIPLEHVYLMAQGRHEAIRAEDEPTLAPVFPGTPRPLGKDPSPIQSSSFTTPSEKAPRAEAIIELPPPPPFPPPPIFPPSWIPPSFQGLDNPQVSSDMNWEPEGMVPLDREALQELSGGVKRKTREERMRGNHTHKSKEYHHRRSSHHSHHHESHHSRDHYHHRHRSHHRSHRRRSQSEEGEQRRRDQHSKPRGRSLGTKQDRSPPRISLWDDDRITFPPRKGEQRETHTELGSNGLFSATPPYWLIGDGDPTTGPNIVELPKGDEKKKSRKNSHKRKREDREGGENTPPDPPDPPPPREGGEGGEGGGQGGNGQGEGGGDGGGEDQGGNDEEDEQEESEDSEEESDSNEESNEESSEDEEEIDLRAAARNLIAPVKRSRKQRSNSKHRKKKSDRRKKFRSRVCGQPQGYLGVLDFLSQLGIAPNFRVACQTEYPVHKRGPVIADFARLPSIEEDDQHLGRLYSFGNTCPAPIPSSIPSTGIPEDILKYLNVARKAERGDGPNADWVAAYKATTVSAEALRRASQRSFPSFFPKIKSQGIRAGVQDDAALTPFSRTLEAAINRLFGIISAVWMGDAQLAVTLATDSIAVLLSEWKKVILLRATETERKNLLEDEESGDRGDDIEGTRQSPIVILRSPVRLGDSGSTSSQGSTSNSPGSRLIPPPPNIPNIPPPPTMNLGQSIPLSLVESLISGLTSNRSRTPPRNFSPNQFFRGDQSGRSPRSRRRPPFGSRSDRDRKKGK
jgi:hypothetical protein